MSRRRKQDIMEVIRVKSSMSQQVVSTKDADYALYSGASYSIASKMALIDTFLMLNLYPVNVRPILKLYRAFLDQQRKAFFASTATEITKLGFLLGHKDDSISAT